MSYVKTKDVLGTVNRGDVAESGLCTLCRADCTGKCETYLSGMLGRKMLYPQENFLSKRFLVMTYFLLPAKLKKRLA